MLESGTRFDPDSYYKIKIDENAETCRVTGQMNGENIDFSNLMVDIIENQKTTNTSEFVINNVESEPKLFILMLDQTYNNSSGKKLIAVNSEYNTALVANGSTSIIPVATKTDSSERLITEYNDGVLTLTIEDSSLLGEFITNTNYSLVYAY